MNSVDVDHTLTSRGNLRNAPPHPALDLFPRHSMSSLRVLLCVGTYESKVVGIETPLDPLIPAPYAQAHMDASLVVPTGSIIPRLNTGPIAKMPDTAVEMNVSFATTLFSKSVSCIASHGRWMAAGGYDEIIKREEDIPPEATVATRLPP